MMTTLGTTWFAYDDNAIDVSITEGEAEKLFSECRYRCLNDMSQNTNERGKNAPY